MDQPDNRNWLEFGGDGPFVSFAHGNGFPPVMYREFLDRITSRYHVGALEARPMWPGSDPMAIDDWNQLKTDLVTALKTRGRHGILGIGHSLGAVCSMLAAIDDPGLFKALVLLDPVLFTGFRSRFWWTLRATGAMRSFPLVKNAANRRTRWNSLEEALISYGSKPFFRRFTPGSLSAYVESVMDPAPFGGFNLRYTPAWEARVFELTPADLWDKVRRIPVPVLVLRGTESDTLTWDAGRRIARELPSAKVLDIPGVGHMLPVEKPDLVANEVLSFLDTHR